MSDEKKVSDPQPAKVTPKELAAFCATIADDRKAENIIQLELSEISVIADYFVLCTGNTEPHIKSIASRIGRDVRDKLGVRPLSIEGESASSWVIIDFGPVVVHVMTPQMRDLYQLENLWGDAPKIDTIHKIDSIRP